jgi:hypothetical protein
MHEMAFMNERAARTLLVVASVLACGIVQLGLGFGMCVTFSLPHDFRKSEEVALVGAVWAVPVFFLASIFASWWLFRSKWFFSACLLCGMPVVVILVLFFWMLIIA